MYFKRLGGYIQGKMYSYREVDRKGRIILRASLVAITILTASLVICGAIQLFYIRKASEAYTRVYNSELPSLAALQELTRINANYHRALLNAILSADIEERRDFTDRMTSLASSYTSQVEKLETLSESSDIRKKLKELLAARKEYEGEGRQLILLLEEGKKEEAIAFRVQNVRPRFERSQQIESQLAELIEQSATVAYRKSDSDLRLAQFTLSILTLWPIVATLLFICLLLVFAIWLWWRLPDESEAESDRSI